MHDVTILTDVVIIFGTAVFAAWAFRFLKAPSIIGFLFAGILIGPSGLELIKHEEVDELAELGLVLLLFIIGLELSPGPLLRMGRGILTATITELVFISSVVTLLVLGTSGLGLLPAVLIGVMVSLSSTAIVLKQLSDRGETRTVIGMVSTGILLLQDIIVIALMIVLPLLGAAGEGDWQSAAVTTLFGLGVMAVALAVGPRLLPMFIQTVVAPGGREMSALFAVLMAGFGAWLAGLAGWSMGLGACIVGMMLSRDMARHQFVADIMPFRDVFNALFFCALGVMVDVSLVGQHLWLIGLAIAVTLPVKALVMTGSIRLGGWPVRPSLQIGIGLCTVSEFSYILAHEADKVGLLPAGSLEIIVAYAVGTMMVGALLVPVAGPISYRVTKMIGHDKTPAEEPVVPEKRHHVVIVGFGVNGSNLARVLQATGVPFIVIEMDPRSIREARKANYEVVLGDASRLVILEHAHIRDAKALVIAISEVAATQQIVSQARRTCPNLFILARTRLVSEVERLYSLGASLVIPEEFETSVEISAHVLKELNIPDNVVESQLAAIRAGGYGMLRGKPTDRAAQQDLMRILQMTATRNYYIEDSSPVIGKSIAELDLGRRTGALIVALVRNGQPETNPSSDRELQAGDILVLVGNHAQLDNAKNVLAGGHDEPAPDR